ncbi:hypothetical protein GGS23DRAFT_523085 [Durotheca rogersii]|uniref:uncharacterized protein n=1 Tax=Durotheca rogersii TaxID=419775 RepID=UPI00221F71C0|nr:uncharacterized protein GGS23DRAFT_523085 [Durotheca rogersii]KAI5863966.1 hypothetical protein GGS23DRAFT_523085 [Durotheca rogersii]
MASPAIALPNGHGLPPVVQLAANTNPNAAISSPDADVNTAQSITSSTKRKRESSDAADKQPNGLNPHRTATPAAPADPASVDAIKVDQPTIRNYYDVLQRYDPTPSVLKRPLPSPDDSADEPHAKRKRPDDMPPQPSISEKVAKEQYADLDSIIVDIKSSIDDQLARLRNMESARDIEANDMAIARLIDFKRQAYGLFKREITYPNRVNVPGVLQTLDSTSDLLSNASGNMVLSVTGEAMRGRQLYTSLQQPVPNPDGSGATIRPLRENGLPDGIKTAKAIPFSFPAAIDKDKKSKTLGELFPPPRNLPSLQPPKAPKSTTKGVQVGWHHPELTEKSKYRAGSYFSQTISAGRWLDYSNAAPPSQIMTKQRERALSLAGNKPSSSDLEMSEMESLFRGAFSSFAPSKDDSAAMISSGLISHTMWWQRVGKRNFDRLVENETPEDAPPEEATKESAAVVEEVDEDLIREALEDWDDSIVDPSLEQACCPKKSDEEKDVDDILQDVSDMIQTLISYQKNRNLTLPSPSSQSRYAADPAHSDMLTNGSPVQPGEEEMATYQALKAQLVVVIQMLPPYAVARLNSDKLDELNISTKIEVRTDEYQGLMEEDEAAARARAATATPVAARPASHRASSSSNAIQYTPQPYHPNRAPMPTPQPYFAAQTPIRPPQQAIQRAPQTMPPNYTQRPPSNAAYRPTPNHYPNAGYQQQFPKHQQYAQPGPYGGTPTQPRPPAYQPMPGYPNMGNATPQPRFPAYAQNAQSPVYHHQPYQPPHQQPPQHNTPAHPPYPQYTNGVGPQRTASPHIPHQTPQHQPLTHLGYNPATPPRQTSYGSQPNMGNDPSRRYYPPAGSPGMPNNQLMPHSQPVQNQPPPGTSSFQTSLNPHQVQQAMDQAKARFDATKSAQRTNEGMRNSMAAQGQGQVGAPVGLGGIGLGGDPSRLAATRGSIPAYPAASQGPNPQMNSPRVTSAPPIANGVPTIAPTPPPATNGVPPGPAREV